MTDLLHRYTVKPSMLIYSGFVATGTAVQLVSPCAVAEGLMSPYAVAERLMACMHLKIELSNF